MKEELYMITALMIVCVVSGLSLAIVYEKVNPIIEEREAEKIKKSLNEIFPEATEFKSGEDLEGAKENYEAIKDGEKIGKIFLVEATGYQDKIVYLVGLGTDGKIKDIKIMKHSETPGLGARITERSFLDQFVGKDNQLEGVDTITGATISTSAIIESIKENFNELS